MSVRVQPVAYVMLTLGFVKVPRGYVKKAELKALPFLLNNQNN
jgi:hypothetical protein